MAPTLVETFPCAPATVRGRGVLLGGHAGKDVILYANGKSIVIRSLAGPQGGEQNTDVRRAEPSTRVSARSETGRIRPPRTSRARRRRGIPMSLSARTFPPATA